MIRTFRVHAYRAIGLLAALRRAVPSSKGNVRRLATLGPLLQDLEARIVDDEGNARLSIHGLVVESQGRTILVDTCIGENWPESNPVRNHCVAFT